MEFPFCPSQTCTGTGKRFYYGVDDDKDGNLDRGNVLCPITPDAEIDGIFEVCDGEEGPQGSTGAQGPQGVQGSPGLSGYEIRTLERTYNSINPGETDELIRGCGTKTIISGGCRIYNHNRFEFSLLENTRTVDIFSNPVWICRSILGDGDAPGNASYTLEVLVICANTQ